MSLKAVRGTKDIFGESIDTFDRVIKNAEDVFGKNGYKHIITPIFEETSLFQRGIGEGTDIVEKEMYTFEDRGGRSLTLRPEATASMVRCYLENKLNSHAQPVKLWCAGPMFRYERPQKGRYRQFMQCDIDIIGEPTNLAEIELILATTTTLGRLGFKGFQIRINDRRILAAMAAA